MKQRINDQAGKCLFKPEEKKCSLFIDKESDMAKRHLANKSWDK